MTEVVAALIWDRDKFMICQRPAHKARGLLWEFVGGKVEPGETKEEALIRECSEELAVTLNVEEKFMDVVHEYPDLTVHLTLFHASIREGVPQKLEHNDIRWITVDEIDRYPFCPADEEILEKLKRSAGHSRCGAQWSVTFEGGFRNRCERGQAEREVSVRREFDWAGRRWLIPSVYLCGEGMVVDFCMRVSPDDIRAFAEKWGLSAESEGGRTFTREEELLLDLDNPMHMDFCSVLHLNGQKLISTHGSGMVYNPCAELGGGLKTAKDGARRAVHHYGLDPYFGWVFWRASYPWATERMQELQTLSVTMAADPVTRPGPHFHVSRPGDTFAFSHEGRAHVLTLRESEAQTADWSFAAGDGMEHPRHFVAMSYTVEPELPDGVMTVADCADGDRPRRTSAAANGPNAACSAAMIGVIGGVDAVAAISTAAPGEDGRKQLCAACSALHFEPVQSVEWRMVFHEKQFEDITVDLLIESNSES